MVYADHNALQAAPKLCKGIQLNFHSRAIPHIDSDGKCKCLNTSRQSSMTGVRVERKSFKKQLWPIPKPGYWLANDVGNLPEFMRVRCRDRDRSQKLILFS